MDRDQLRERLSKSYDRATWLAVVSTVFPNVAINATPGVVEVEDTQVRRFHQLGSVALDDGKHLALFEVELQPNVQISRNRVGVRNLIAKLIDQADIHGALGVFTPDGDSYRFTFAAKDSTFTEDGEFVQTETAPKRYTYLLGPTETCLTAAQRLDELRAKGEKMTLADVQEAFSLERLNKDFYARVREFYTRLVGGTLDKAKLEGVLRLPGGNTDPNVRKYFAVRLLARTIFCWFLKHKYLDELRRFRRENPGRFRQIRNMPTRARCGREDDGLAGTTVAFIRNRQRDGFYHVQEDGALTGLGFVECARLFRAAAEEAPRALPGIHHEQVGLAEANFQEKVQEEIVTARTVDAKQGPNEKQALIFLNACGNMPITSDREKDLIGSAKVAIRMGKFQQLTRDVNKIRKSQTKTKVAFSATLETLLGVLNKYPVGDPDEKPAAPAEARRLRLDAEIVISESFVAGATPQTSDEKSEAGQDQPAPDS